MAGPTLTQDELDQFTGSEVLYKHPLMPRYSYTSGVRFLARRAECYWLLDAIVSHQHSAAVRREPFQSWTLTRTGSRAALVCTDGDSDTPVVRQEIEFTDFPLDSVTVWVEDNVLMLPTER